MSTDFKNIYVAAVIVSLLFGVGVGYQIANWTDDSEEVECSTNQTATTIESATSSPVVQGEIYVRTGKVTVVGSDSIQFQAYIQKSNGAYERTTLTARTNNETTFTKVNINNPEEESTVSLSDVQVGDEVAVQSAENVYGVTSFTATSVQIQYAR